MATYHTIKFRRRTSSSWAALNPVLAEGEPGLERDTGKLKIGNGFTHWLELPYFIPIDVDTEIVSTLPEHIASPTPHPAYDDAPSLTLLYENAKV